MLDIFIFIFLFFNIIQVHVYEIIVFCILYFTIIMSSITYNILQLEYKSYIELPQDEKRKYNIKTIEYCPEYFQTIR